MSKRTAADIRHSALKTPTSLSQNAVKDISAAMTLDGEASGEWESRADPKRYSRAALFGVIAAREAWNDAGLRAAELNAGVVVGTGGGGADINEYGYREFFTNGGRHVTPYAIAIGICGKE